MAVQKISIEEFLFLAKSHPVLDVRSPAEYKQAHIPGASNFPLFSDKERQIVGTSYKQENRATAIKIGLDFFGPKMRSIVENAEKITNSFEKNTISKNESHFEIKEADTRHPKPVTVLLHCWRGGMRSAAIAWLLDLYGFQVITLSGGYKAYRNWVLKQFEKEYHFKIIGGFTGSGKTLLLKELEKQGSITIDLEALANHKGSALGGIGKGAQPKQEMFENLLAGELFQKASQLIFLEDESQRIGNLQIPMALWHSIRKSRVYFFDIPFEKRLDYLTEEYGVQSKEKLAEAIGRIQKRLGGLETKNSLAFLEENNFKECFRILLKYYDKYYLKGLHNRENVNDLIKKIPAMDVNPQDNLRLLNNSLAQIKI